MHIINLLKFVLFVADIIQKSTYNIVGASFYVKSFLSEHKLITSFKVILVIFSTEVVRIN